MGTTRWPVAMTSATSPSRARRAKGGVGRDAGRCRARPRAWAKSRLVRAIAADRHLPCVFEHANVRQLAQEQKLSLEMAARRLRHQFLARAARARGLRCIALAHHADDQVELFFLRLLRGSGGQGLAGMKWIGPSPVDRRVSLVRPLLGCSKADLLQFALANFFFHVTTAYAILRHNGVELGKADFIGALD